MTMTMSSPAESEQNDIFDRVGPLTTEKLIILKTNAKSRANFAVLLLKELFDQKELEGKNIAGSCRDRYFVEREQNFAEPKRM